MTNYDIVNAAADYNKIISDIQNGFDGDIHPSLFKGYTDNYHKALSMFDKQEYGDTFFELSENLKLNTSRFAAYKTHQITKQLKAVKNKANYQQVSKEIIKKFNRYQATEYNSVVSRARTAKQFKQFQTEADIFPNLEWLATRSVNARELHVQITGTILPINHPFWSSNQPGNLWGCKCNWRTTDSGVTSNPGNDLVKPAIGLEGNPAITREIFTDNHPYINKIIGDIAVEKFVKDYVNNSFVVIKSFENGKALVHPMVNTKGTDYTDLKQISMQFAEAGNHVQMLPEVNIKSRFYGYLFDGAYENKCPDLKIGNKFYEYENFTGNFNKGKISNMLNSGMKQSENIIINTSRESTDNFILKLIHARINGGFNIKEVWIFNDNKLRRLF